MKRFFWFIALLMLSVNAFAQTTSIPPMMNFQGHLAKPDGTPVPDGNYQITFSIFPASTGGTANWTQTMNPVMVHNGAFAVLLGNGNPLTADILNGTPYLEIKVGSDAALAPRQQFASVAFAFKANIAITVPDGAITKTKIASNAVGNVQLDFDPLSITRVSGGTLTSQNGNIGININTPQATLHVFAPVGNANLRLQAFPASTSVNFGVNSAGDLFLSNFADGVYHDHAVILGNGSVGIGTTSPSAILDVNGDVNVQNFLRLQPIFTTPIFDSVARYWCEAGVGARYDGYSHRFDVGQGTRIEAMRIDAGGYVGIGTPSPQRNLSVQNGLNIDQADANDGTIQANSLTFGSASGEGIASKRSSGPGGYGLDFYTGFFSRMSIDNGGFVSIGGSAGVGGSLSIGGNTTIIGNGNGVIFPDGTKQTTAAGGTANGNAGGDLTGTYPAPTIKANAVTGAKLASDASSLGKVSDGVIINYNGKIGINTLSPQTALDVVGTVKMHGFQYPDGTSNGYVLTADNSGIGTWHLNVPGDGTVTNPKLANGSVDSFKLTANAVDVANLKDGVVNGAKLASDASSLSKVTAGAVSVSNSSLVMNNGGRTITIGNIPNVYPYNAGAYGISVQSPSGPANSAGIYVNQGGISYVTANNVSPSSDIRLKTNIQPICNPLDIILALQGHTFNWRADMAPTPSQQIGFIAQEIEKVLPDVVTITPSGYKAVSYNSVTPILVEAMKAQQKQIEDLKAQLKKHDDQQTQIDELKKQLTALLEAAKQNTRK